MNAFQTPWRNYRNSASSPYFSRLSQDSGTLGIQIATRDVPELNHLFLSTFSLRHWIKWRVQYYKNFELWLALLSCFFTVFSFVFFFVFISGSLPPFLTPWYYCLKLLFISNNIYFPSFFHFFKYPLLFLYFLGFFCILSILFLPFFYLLHFPHLVLFTFLPLLTSFFISSYFFHAALFILLISLFWQTEHITLHLNTRTTLRNISVNCVTFSFWPRSLRSNGDKHFPYVSVKNRIPASSLYTVISPSEP